MFWVAPSVTSPTSPGVKPEDQSSAGELWSAGIIHGSLMHDVDKTLVYCTYTGKRDTTSRLKRVFKKAGPEVIVLRSSVDLCGVHTFGGIMSLDHEQPLKPFRPLESRSPLPVGQEVANVRA